MKTRTLAAVAQAVNGRLIGADAPFGAVGTDTRTLAPRSLFVAIRGERYDGNAFVADAAAKGAAGAMVSAVSGAALAQVEVEDTRAALGAMARAWRRRFEIPVVAVTGSSGKTTVKELIAAILGVGRRVCVTQGNLNNDIGLPLTLMRLEPADEAAVVELGANHAGEIDVLARIACPTVGVITNAGPAHLEGFGSIAGVAAAKGELLDHLPAGGAAVLNADDPYEAEWRARSTAARVLTFALRRDADFALVGEPERRGAGTRFTMAMPGGTAEVELPLIGLANVANALAAAAAAFAVGAGADEIAAGLERAAAVRGRMHALAGRSGAVVIDDSYNANPASARAALDYLATLGGRRVLALGDMRELGPGAETLHRELGEHARGRCDVLVAIGPLARHAAAAFGERGTACDDVASAIDALDALLADDVTVLVKGSRAMGLERIVAALAKPAEGGQC